MPAFEWAKPLDGGALLSHRIPMQRIPVGRWFQPTLSSLYHISNCYKGEKEYICRGFEDNIARLEFFGMGCDDLPHSTAIQRFAHSNGGAYDFPSFMRPRI